MKCVKCGTEFNEGIFCPECGTKYEEPTESIVTEPTENNNPVEQKKIEKASVVQEQNDDSVVQDNKINDNYEKPINNSNESTDKANISQKGMEQGVKLSSSSKDASGDQKKIPWYIKAWLLILLAIFGCAVNVLWVPFLILLGMRIMYNKMSK